MRPRLVTIPLSHYGERARWALDYAGCAYDEEHHLQIFSWPVTFRHTGGKYVPFLLTSGGVVSDSAKIVQWASERARAPLYPEDAGERAEIEAFERDCAELFGVESRRWAYDAFLKCPEETLPYNLGRAPAYEAATVRVAMPVVIRFFERYLGLSPSAVGRAKDIIDRAFDRVGRRLADGREFLFGGRFTAADLTFAALAAPVILPPEYGVPMPKPELLLPAAHEQILRWREHPTGAYVQRLYATRR